MAGRSKGRMRMANGQPQQRKASCGIRRRRNRIKAKYTKLRGKNLSKEPPLFNLKLG
jgi:hypothetical protein